MSQAHLIATVAILMIVAHVGVACLVLRLERREANTLSSLKKGNQIAYVSMNRKELK